MTDDERLAEACEAHGLRCPKCHWSALIVLRLLGLERAVAFVRRQWPH